MNDSDLSFAPPRRSGRRKLCGRAATARAIFVPERRGDPLGAYPSLRIEGRPLNLWLTDCALKPVLSRWSRRPADHQVPSAAVRADVEWGSERARDAFREVLPAAVRVGEPAVLAALGVATNLVRTLAVCGEFMLEAAPPPTVSLFRLSRHWCGLVEYADSTPYFPARIEYPSHAGRLRAHQRDPRHLRNALWCSSTAISEHCAEAIAILREEIRRAGVFTPDDARHLHADSIP
jgi:hypothetical protein